MNIKQQGYNKHDCLHDSDLLILICCKLSQKILVLVAQEHVQNKA